MRAVVMEEYGEADRLRLVELPVPELRDGCVRVRVAAAGVNPADHKWREGLFRDIMPIRFPHILGYDIAGTVDAVGAGVTGLFPGDRVCAMLDAVEKGGYAEYVLVDAAQAVAIPAGLDFAEAAALPTPALTGVQLINEHVRPASGDTVLISGAVGAVGRFALSAARKMGVRVVAAVRESQREAALALGADAVVSFEQPIWKGEAFDHVADTVGGEAVAVLCRFAAPGARIVTVSTSPIPAAGLPSLPLFIGVHQDPAGLSAILRGVAADELTLSVALRLPLAEAAQAHRLVAAGGNGGKIILLP